AYIKGRSALLITDLDSTEYTYRFSVKPLLDSCRVKKVKFVNPHEQEEEKIYYFAEKKLKIINHKLDNYAESQIDWLLLSADKIPDIDKLKRYNQTQHLLIDGKNRDFIIDTLKKQTLDFDFPVSILKRNAAVEINLDN